MSSLAGADELDRRLAQRRSEHLSSVDLRALAWLGVAPVWTDTLAAAAGFPAADLDQFLRSAESAGWATVFRDRFTNDRSFFVKERRRADVITQCRSGGVPVEGVLQQASTGLRRAQADLELPHLDIAWLRLLDSADRDQLPETFYAQVEALCRRTDVAGATELLEAGRVLATILGGSFERAVERADHRIEREKVRQVDRLRMERYLPRPSHTQALTEFLSARGRNDPWALHLVGMGGIGKTMLIRYLGESLRHDVPELPEIVLTRVDFDRISADYPTTRPGQLIAEFANHLTLEATSAEADAALSSVREAVRTLHKNVDQSAGPAIGPDGTMSPLMEAVLDRFCELCDTLDAQVVVVLDTCEELAKVHPAGQPVEGIRKMFQIVEALHERRNTLRFLFAGRRLLAGAYANWSPVAGAAAPSVVDLQPRPYLTMFELRGFTPDDVESLLRLRDVSVTRATTQRLIEAAGDAGRVQGLGGSDESFANPFEVDLFVQMLTEEHISQRDSVVFDVNAYIRSRIVGRLEGDEAVLAKVLPAAALFGRFDEEMLAPVVGADGAALDVMRRLKSQEWIEPDLTGGDRTWFTIKPGLCDRLRRYYAERGELSEAATGLAPWLRELVTHRRLRKSAPDHLLWAVRLCSPEDAGDLWDALECRAEMEGAWPLLAQVAAELRATDGNTYYANAIGPIDAALTATQLAQFRREHPQYRSGGLWGAVERMAAAHPLEHLAASLVVRARLGRLVDAFRSPHDTPPDWEFALEMAESPPPDGAQRWVAGLVSALDAAIEDHLDVTPWEWSGRPWPARRLSGFEYDGSWVATMDPGLAGFARMVAARYAAAAGESREAVGLMFAQALALVTEDEKSSAPRRWADWTPPADLPDRIKLLWLLHGLRGSAELASNEAIAEWDVDLESANIDRERLASLLVLMLQSNEGPDDELMDEIGRAGRRPVVLVPECLAHRQVPPLGIVVAETVAARGSPMEALTLLADARYVGDQALGMSTGRPESGSAFEYGRAGTALVQQSLRAATGVLRRWRLDQKRILKLASQFPDLVDDVAEARLLLGPAGASDGVALRSASDDAASSEAAARAVLAGAGTTDDIVRVDRALLRTRGREGVDDARFEDYWRRTAQVALAEGEILSLTDPATGSELLQLARERFTAVRDAPGELFALVLWHLAVAREGKALTSDAANELMAAYEAAAPSRVDKDLRLVREPAGRSAGIAELAGWETRLRAALSAAGHADGEVPKGDVPSEMKLPAPSPSPFSFLPMPVTSRLSPRRLLQWVVEWTVAGLLIFAPVVAWWAVRKLTPLPDAGFWACYFQVWGVIAVVLGIGGLGRRRRTGKSQPWTALRVRARPLTAPGREDELAGARVTVEVEPFCAPSRYSRIRAIAPLERTAGRVLADLAGPNRFDVELSLAPGLSPPLLDLGSRAVLARHRVVILDLDDDLVSLDWEKWRVGPVDSARLHHFRNYPPLDAAAPWTQAVDVVAERAWQGLGQDVWMPSSRELRLWSGDIPAGGSISCVIHAIGTPVPSSSGWRLRINNLRPAIKAAEPVDREVLVGPEGLHVVGKVVILQSKPDRDESSVDRDGLRAIAHDFMLGGAQAVIVLPSLPRRLVSSALSQTANQLFARGQTPRLRELLAFTQDIRRTADVGKDHGADSAWDITGNVSLFARFEED